MSNSNRKRSNNNQNEKSGIPFIGNLRRVELIGIGILILAVFMYMIRGCGGSGKSGPNATEITNKTDSLAANKQDAELHKALQRRLYVCIDSLKLRTGPYLDSTLIAQLPFGEELVDMGQSSAFEQTIRISLDYTATEPWIKVRTKEGKVGWVYGAGIRPYKKRKVLPNTTPQAPENGNTPNNSGNNNSNNNRNSNSQ